MTVIDYAKDCVVANTGDITIIASDNKGTILDCGKKIGVLERLALTYDADVLDNVDDCPQKGRYVWEGRLYEEGFVTPYCESLVTMADWVNNALDISVGLGDEF
jgi:hypothetical protein